ncbi:MAG: M23 family metallopeptidase [Bacteroidales bacterium]
MRIIILLTCLITFLKLQAQINPSPKYFSSPVEGTLKVSSNFGKIRENHFHAGLDINTNLHSGVSILAAGEGYISRVNISPSGYGKAVYITHPNGLVTVYGHLSEIRKDVSDSIKKFQYLVKRFAVDMKFPEGKFKVKKGEVIGKSGNTGNSFGAHLHFEVRDEVSEHILNPFNFGFNIPDNAAPVFNRAYFYRYIMHENRPVLIKREKIKINNGDTVSTFNFLGIGIEVIDYLSRNKGNFDPWQVKMYSNDSLVFHYRFDSFSFDEARYVNSFSDYAEYRLNRTKIIKCFIEPNNKLKIYKTSGNGLLNVEDGKVQKIKILASDYKGNTGKLSFYIKSDSSESVNVQNTFPWVKKLNCCEATNFVTDSFRIFFTENSLFNDLNFNYSVSATKANEFSKYHLIHYPDVPIMEKAEIEIKPIKDPDSLSSKLFIARAGNKGAIIPAGGTWSEGFLKTSINQFGTYFIEIDTMPPTINPVVLKSDKHKSKSRLQFKIQDKQSGISEYAVYIDEKWVLFEFDQKNDLISCNLLNENIKKGKHNLIIWVRDKCNNLGFYEKEIEI